MLRQLRRLTHPPSPPVSMSSVASAQLVVRFGGSGTTGPPPTLGSARNSCRATVFPFFFFFPERRDTKHKWIYTPCYIAHWGLPLAGAVGPCYLETKICALAYQNGKSSFQTKYSYCRILVLLVGEEVPLGPPGLHIH